MPKVPGIGATECNLDTQHNQEVLRARRFYSLVRLLPTPKPVHVRSVALDDQRSTYQPVVDGPALQRLVAAVHATATCAIDTEATDKDPRRAELLGVSFCFKQGEGFYVPLTSEDLRGLDSAQVLRALREIARCGAIFIGHNVKYDDVVLRRHGVALSNIGFDTMLAAHECFHDWEFFNLKHLAQVLLGKTIKKYGEVVKDHKSLLDVPFQRLVQYACEDADAAFQLYKVLGNELQTRGLQAQFESETMTLASQLGRWEFAGIPVDEHRLQALRMDARSRLDTARDAIQNHFGKGLNVDSDQEIQAALLEDGEIAELLRSKRPTTALLETLAGTSEAARRLVQYRRERDVLRRIEEVMEHSQDRKVHPVFNQISSRYGQVTARQPNLFATNVVREAVDESVWHLYTDTKRSLNALVTLSRDDRLSADLMGGYPADFSCLGETVGDFLLSLAIGTSNSKISRRFLLEQSLVGDLRHRMRIRYRHVFQWVDAVRTDAIKYGFVENDGHRYYVAGLGSSNLHKRQQATNLCV
jgi:DNA polymerase I-like protein with 3'-5' exonuclease and polymerase domains